MKLLLDNNLSPKLVARLQNVFPECQHVVESGLEAVEDAEVWRYAKAEGLVIVTKDSDFNDMSVLRGAPPQVIWLKLGNCTTAQIETLLVANVSQIEAFVTAGTSRILVLL